jgi:hypothetical protein
MKRSNFSVVLYVLLVFLSGALVGAFGHRLYTTKTVSAKSGKRPGPDEYRKRYMDEMSTRLKLDATQVQQLTVILDETRQRYKEARDRMDPEMKRIQEEQRDRIRGMLSADQRSEYEKMIEEKDRKYRDSRKSHGPPPGC